MKDIFLNATKLSKRFLIFNSEKTLLRSFKSLFRLKGLKSEFWALRDISFSLEKGEKLAVIGKNGSGKTTLLRILAGIYDRTSGQLFLKRSPLVLFDLSVGFNEELSVIDNIYLFGAVCGMSSSVLRPKLDFILATAELEHLKFLPFKGLSTGQRQRIALSVFFQVDHEFIVIDEGLTSVDRSFSQKCDAYLDQVFASDRTMIISSHDPEFLRRHCTRALWLDQGKLRMSGSTEEVLRAYENA
jgi:ABC-type polysaccharide/polyol phosphate transport system ATPase subunit